MTEKSQYATFLHKSLPTVMLKNPNKQDKIWLFGSSAFCSEMVARYIFRVRIQQRNHAAFWHVYLVQTFKINGVSQTKYCCRVLPTLVGLNHHSAILTTNQATFTTTHIVNNSTKSLLFMKFDCSLSKNNHHSDHPGQNPVFLHCMLLTNMHMHTWHCSIQYAWEDNIT